MNFVAGQKSWFDEDFMKEEEEDALEDISVGVRVDMVGIPVHSIIYQEHSGFGVYIMEDENDKRFTIKGVFVAPLVIGQTYRVTGKVITYNSKFGKEKQVSVDDNGCKNVVPVSEKGIVLYLQTLKGLKSRAQKIFEIFGSKSIEVLMNEPMKVCNAVSGIGKKSVMDWQKQLEKMKDSQGIIMKLLEFGLTTKQSKRLYDTYKEAIVSMIEENPYILAKEVKGYGFLSCDRIARNMGFDPKSPYRIQEGTMYVLDQSTLKGHCFLPGSELVEETMTLLDIKLSVQEMNKFSKEYSGQITFNYPIGGKDYSVDYNEMTYCLEQYKMAYMKQKEQFKYKVVEITTDEVLEGIKSLLDQRRIIIDEKRIYLSKYYFAEREVARYVKEIVDNEEPIEWDIQKALRIFCKSKGIELEDMQEKAVIEMSTSKGGMHILSGSAGCGKTFSLKIILEMLKVLYTDMLKEEMKVMLLAPTGKASQVATKATGIECKTVHRGLVYSPVNGFEYNENNPLDCDVIIVDETSMLDILLAYDLFQAVLSRGTKVIFLGDVKQLASVGAGNVLKDLIESDVVKVVTLNVVKRQGELSGLLGNAYRIIDGEMIIDRPDTDDAYFIPRKTQEGVLKAIIKSMKKLIIERGYPIGEVQVLCPMKNGMVGVEYMNYVLQQTFNPGENGHKVLNKKVQVSLNGNPSDVTNLELYFKKGDKVIHIKNNYDIFTYVKTGEGLNTLKADTIGMTNGETGIIEEITKERNSDGAWVEKVIVRYDDGKYVIYDEGVSELEHAYALTVHKSQGSAWEAVLIPVVSANAIMLDNNIFYTAWTRARSFAGVVGDPDVLFRAIKTYKSRDRYTSLKEQINAQGVA